MLMVALASLARVLLTTAMVAVVDGTGTTGSKLIHFGGVALSGNATIVSLIPGSMDLNPFCYECPNSTYADMVADNDLFVKAHTEVFGTCADHGFAKALRSDPIFHDAKLFWKGGVRLPGNDTRVSLVPGSVDLNPLCYECPNGTYADMVADRDPLVKAHTKVDGTCADHDYAKGLGNDPIFRDAKLFRRSTNAELMV